MVWALGRQDLFPAAFLELITALRCALPFEDCSWVLLPCPQSLGGGARYAALCFCVARYEELDLDVWGCSSDLKEPMT